ncbi:Rv2175c family DNA-binding protein [Amycolatopsis antarctica]|uniref:Rv2175c family DNA-binding protein n=1 Tax=Amycolatopsis antarctica TaxID=1854586 RepID=UPI0013FE4C64|nr:Rv2175c family DNA-binding protein [Amycolatopsis antarctica]
MSGIPVADDVLGADVAMLPLSEVSDSLGVSENKVRQFLREGTLIAIRRDGDLHVPAAFLDDGAVVKSLTGTITVLSDSGFSHTEMIRWLFEKDDSLAGGSPIEALRGNHGTEVKRRAQAMAF